MKHTVIVMALLLGAAAAAAVAMTPIQERQTFLQAMDGRSLKIWLYGLSLDVNDDGTITGRAAGRDVTGTWTWQGGYFCREMAWGSMPIDYNCQLVEIDGDTMRFTTDRGAGDYADFRLR
ncbi:MAG: dihydrodipicolinate reductase [Pseudomonadota bacterium]